MEVKLINLTKEFAKQGSKKSKKEQEATVVAVDHINVDIPSGKLIGLLGPSGCGKSTTLFMIAGLHKPTGGEIYFGDRRIDHLPPEKRGIGLVFQNYALYPHLTVAQNIMFPLESRGEPKKMARETAQKYAELVGIGGLMDRKTNQLSGGQQQRVAIARALVKEPEVLLLDEPLSNLDARLRLQTREEIRKIQRTTGTTTIFVTHDQEEAMSISDEIVVMNLGVVHQIGKPQDVYNEPIDMFVAKFLGTPPINIIEGHFENGIIDIYGQKLNIKLDDDFESKLKLTAKQSNIENYQSQENNQVVNDASKVFIGIRPEFIVLDPEGDLEMIIDYVEFIGRDKTVIFKFEGCDTTFKAITQENEGLEEGKKVRFRLKKLFVFDENGKRLY